jgi:lactate 2-monooxygenase
VELGFTDPVFQKHFREKYGKSIKVDKSAAAAEWTRTTFSGLSRG